MKKQKKDSSDKPKQSSPSKIGKAAENGKTAINSLFRTCMDRMKDKCPYVANFLRFDADVHPTFNNYLERHRATIRVENPNYNAPARVREDLLVNYTEQDEVFRAELISTKHLTVELLKLFQLKTPDYLMMSSLQLVTALRQVVLETYGVDSDDREEAAKERYEAIKMSNNESIDAFTQRFKDAYNDYDNHLAQARKLTHTEVTRHYMKGLSADYDSEKIELKNEENLKAKFSNVIAGLNIEGAGAAFAAADVGYPTTIDGLRDRVSALANQRKRISNTQNLRSFPTIRAGKSGKGKRGINAVTRANDLKSQSQLPKKLDKFNNWKFTGMKGEKKLGKDFSPNERPHYFGYDTCSHPGCTENHFSILHHKEEKPKSSDFTDAQKAYMTQLVQSMTSNSSTNSSVGPSPTSSNSSANGSSATSSASSSSSSSSSSSNP